MEKLKQLQQGLSFADSDSGESDVETKNVDETSHARLLDDISTMDGSKRLTHSLRGVHGQTMSESGMPSQGVEADRVMSDLMGSLQKSASHGVIKKQLRSAFKTGKVVDTPAPKHLKQKIQRTVGYETTVKEISKWDPVVTANRKVPQLRFPMEQPTTKLINAHLVFRPVTALEVEMAALLSKVKPEDRIQKGKVFTLAEERAMAAMSLEEAKAKRNELLQKRQIMYTRNSKLRWQNKIKSKRYRRAKKKEKEQKTEKELEELALADPQAVMDRLEESDKKRILERGRLRHAGGKKFAREARIFAKYDDEKRQQLEDMLSKHRLLKKKNEVVLSSSDSDDDDDDDGDGGSGPNKWVRPQLWPAPSSSVDTAVEETSLPPTTTTTTPISISSPWGEDEETAQPAGQEPQGRDQDDDDDEEEEETLRESVAETKNDTKQFAAKNAPERDARKDGEPNTELVAGTDQHDGKEAEHRAGERSQKQSRNRASASTPANAQLAEEAWQKKEDKKKTTKKDKKERKKKEKNKKKKPDSGSPQQKNQAGEQKPTNKSRSQKPTINEIRPQKPTTNESGSQKPMTNESGSQKPTTNESGSQKPMTNESSSKEAVLISIGEAFDDDDVVADFVEEKEETMEEEREKDVDTFLPGWGRWAGAGIQQPARVRQKFIVKAAPTSRDDNKIGHVVITKKRNLQIEKHKAEKLPYQYKSVRHMKKGLSTPLDQYSCKPKTVVTRIGQVIQPLQDSVLLQTQKRKAVDIDLNIKKSKKRRH